MWHVHILCEGKWIEARALFDDETKAREHATLLSGMLFDSKGYIQWEMEKPILVSP